MKKKYYILGEKNANKLLNNTQYWSKRGHTFKEFKGHCTWPSVVILHFCL